MTDTQRKELNRLDHESKARMAKSHAHSSGQIKEFGYRQALKEVAEILLKEEQ